MGKSFWDWMFEDEEVFVDTERGIYYRGSGNTRSTQGRWKNFGDDRGVTYTEEQVNQIVKKAVREALAEQKRMLLEDKR